MILHPTLSHRSGQFQWHPETTTFSAEASELRWPKGWPTTLGQVYDDAIDEGFTFISDKTGAEVVVVIDKVDEDNDYSGGWKVLTFVPADRKLRNLFKVVVFND